MIHYLSSWFDSFEIFSDTRFRALFIIELIALRLKRD